MSTHPGRQARIIATLKPLLLELSGFNLDELDTSTTFLELGLESLLLIQLSQAIQSEFSVKISFRQLIETIDTVEGLAAYLDENMPTDALPAEPVSEMAPNPVVTAPISEPPPAPPVDPMPPAPAPIAPVVQTMPAPPVMSEMPSTTRGGIEDIMQQQLHIMSMQLEALRGSSAQPQPAAPPQDGPIERPAELEVVPTVERPAAPPVRETPPADTSNATTQTIDPDNLEALQRQRFGPYKPIKRGVGGQLTEQQQVHLDDLIQSLNARTPTSKQLAQTHRSYFADPRAVSGFRKIWKEMVYQITVERSKGSKLWDVDGNEYVDIAMGFGLNLLGQSPDFVTTAVAQQLERGVEIGPQSPLAGEVAKLLCEFSGLDRATFCNTGSEAVMAAIRVARAVTGRRKIVSFNSSYHGTFDQVLVRSAAFSGTRRMLPAVPGVPQSNADDALVLDYGTPDSLEVIRAHADEIAAVLVEPVQSAHIDLQPKAYLQELRTLTQETGIALVMDEVISGFRAAPGGAQAYFGVQGDMATYGKVLGGGMPIGALAGRAHYMDALDSGMWQFGDDSVPEADVTFFAGTFVRHPLALTAAHAVLTYLKAQGPELQAELTRRTTAMVDRLNTFFESEFIPIRLIQFTSLFRFSFPSDLDYIDLLYYHMLNRGLFTRGFQENCFLSTAHSDADIDFIIDVIQQSVLAMRAGGFLPEPETASTRHTLTTIPADHGDPFIQPPHWVRETVGQQFPLTEAETEIWLVSQLSPQASATYNEPLWISLQGELQVSHLRRAMQTMIARHEAFHMRFSSDGTYQEPVPPVELDIPVLDFSGLASESQEQAIQAVYAEVGSTPFDLVHGPLVRIQILKLADTDHIISFSCHHIVCDGWSIGVLMDEISQAYSSLCQNQPFRLPPAPMFSAYATRQASEAQEAERTEAYQYWQDQFADRPPMLELPTDRPRPALKSSAGGTVHWRFKPEVYDAIKHTAASQNATFFTILFAAFNVLLARLSGQTDIVMTIPTAGQPLSGEPNLVGHCINLLPVRSRLDMNMSFQEFLAASSTNILDAYDHADCTYGGIVRHLQLPRNPSRLPLTEVNFNLDRDRPGQGFHGLKAQIGQPPKQAVNFDLFFNINELEDGLVTDFDYNTTLFDATTIERWIGHYEVLLQAIAENPSQALAELPLLGKADLDTLLTTWNATEAPYPQKSVHALVAEQAARTPDAVAVIDESTSVSYRDLETQANQLAWHLQTLGVKPGQLVGICLDRSHSMLVGLLGILKAGCAYVPLDPTYPRDRLAYMVEDADLHLLVTEQAVTEALPIAARPTETPVKLINLDSDWPVIAQQPQTAPPQAFDPERPAYVIYTSGSTGRPKGVQVPHRALTNFLMSMQQEPGLTAHDVLLSVTTLSFDIAALELYLPLMTGAQVILPRHETVMDGAQLTALLQQHEVTVMQATPSTWRLLLDSGWKGNPQLTMLCGGEALPLALAKELIRQGRALWNMYGPTETTIWSVISQVEPEDTLISIGRPISNTQVYILNDSLQPVPVGIAGTLYIGGEGLATGYLHRPELTAERFVVSPFDARKRLYNTGDLARYLPDGRIECLGRLDQQVKLRGFRIELGEIEAVLSQHDAIHDTVVAVHDADTGDKRLIAYNVATTDVPSPTELRRFLQTRLPDYMIPTHFIFLEQLPRTPNGKIDRNALPAPDGGRPDLEIDYIAPQTEVEKQLATIWVSILGLEQVGVHDNFFDLGGHSLLAIQVGNRVRETLDITLPMTSVFELPTVRGLAQRVEAIQYVDSTSQLAIQHSREERDVVEF